MKLDILFTKQSNNMEIYDNYRVYELYELRVTLIFISTFTFLRSKPVSLKLAKFLRLKLDR